jgi:hypothetical protein
VLGAIASSRPAVDAYAVVVAARPGWELHNSPAGVDVNRGALKFAIEEWDEAEHIVALHGLFISLELARVASDVLAAGGSG